MTGSGSAGRPTTGMWRWLSLAASLALWAARVDATSYSCSFDTYVSSTSDPCNDGGTWATGVTDNSMTLLSTSTTSTSTGPSSDVSGSGYYIYVESSSPNYPSVKFDLTSMEFDNSISLVSFYYHMYGASMGTANLQGSNDGSSWTTLWSKSGNQGNYWSAAAVYPGASYDYVRFYFTTSTSYTSDFALDNIVVETEAPSAEPTRAPTMQPTGDITYYECDFDSGGSGTDMCNDGGYWTSGQDGDLSLTLNTGSTGSTSTGPSNDVSGSGYYAYVESSSPNFPYVTFDLTSAEFLGGIETVAFYYHMYGSTMGAMALSGSSDSSTWIILWSLSGNQGNSWNYASVSVGTEYKYAKFSFVTTTSFTSDFAVDEIIIRAASTPPPSSLPTPLPTPLPTLAVFWCGQGRYHNRNATCDFNGLVMGGQIDPDPPVGELNATSGAWMADSTGGVLVGSDNATLAWASLDSVLGENAFDTTARVRFTGLSARAQGGLDVGNTTLLLGHDSSCGLRLAGGHCLWARGSFDPGLWAWPVDFALRRRPAYTTVLLNSTVVLTANQSLWPHAAVPALRWVATHAAKVELWEWNASQPFSTGNDDWCGHNRFCVPAPAMHYQPFITGPNFDVLPCSCKAAGTDYCDAISGNCVCKALYEGTGCGTKQSLELSFIAALVFLGLVVLGVPPLLFFSGMLGVLSRRLRQGLDRQVNRYQAITSAALALDAREQSEHEQQQAARPPESTLRKRLRFVVTLVLYLALLTIVAFMLFIGHGIKLAFNVYLVVSSFGFSVPHKMEVLGDEIVTFMTWISPDLAFFGLWWDRAAEVLDWVWSIFNINLVRGVEVTCFGAQAPVYLFMNYCLVALVVVMFDSQFYIFVAVSIADYRLAPNRNGRNRWLKPREMALKLFFFVCERSFKGMVQVMLSSVVLTKFLPAYSKTSDLCDTELNDADSFFALLSTLVFWLLLPATLHLLINTFVPGLAPQSWLDQMTGNEPGSGSLGPSSEAGGVELCTVPATNGAEVEPGSGTASTSEGAASSFEAYRSKFEDDLLGHDPAFWQNFSLWARFLVDKMGNGSVLEGFRLYCLTILWKTKILLKLTLGLWDQESVENFDVKERAEKMDLNGEDAKQEDMLAVLGDSHSLIWQFFPALVVVAKLGEALNSQPLLVPDGTIRWSTPPLERFVKWVCYLGEFVSMAVLCVESDAMLLLCWVLFTAPLIAYDAWYMLEEANLPRPDWEVGRGMWVDFEATMASLPGRACAIWLSLGSTCATLPAVLCNRARASAPIPTIDTEGGDTDV